MSDFLRYGTESNTFTIDVGTTESYRGHHERICCGKSVASFGHMAQGSGIANTNHHRGQRLI